jgi:hypothetical protein
MRKWAAMRINVCGLMLFAGIAVALHSQADRSPKFELLARYKALGGLMATTVAPGDADGSELLYASYLYADNTLDVIAVDPATGKAEVFHNPVPGEYGARNIAVGPDGNVYLGSLPHAHFLKVDRMAHRLIDLGRPSASEEYIWDVAFGMDQRLYGVTYPGCRLVRYDPATHTSEDLGKMDPTEKYGRWIVGGRDGYMYIGIGTAKANIAVFNVKTGELREVLPQDMQIADTPKPYIGADGGAYATLGNHLFALDGFKIHELPMSAKVEPYNPDVLKNGDALDLSEDRGILSVKNARTGAVTSVKISYDGEDLQVFRIGYGPDGLLYGSSILPIHFLKIEAGNRKIEQLGDLGGGEIYSFLSHNGRLLMGAYSGLSPLMSYETGKAVSPAADGNPELINFDNSDDAWRPQAMIQGPDDRVYVGGTAGYGKLEGPLVSWTGAPGSVQQHTHLVKDQSVISLATWKNYVVGGTTILGGGGSHPAGGEAHLFLWNTISRSKDFDIVPVPGAQTITCLATAKSGLIYGIAISGATHTLFAFNPESRLVTSRRVTPFHGVVYNAVGETPSGRLVGLAEKGIFTIDEGSGDARVIARTPMKITGGFALRNGAVYFISNSEIYRYRLKAPYVR